MLGLQHIFLFIFPGISFQYFVCFLVLLCFFPILFSPLYSDVFLSEMSHILSYPSIFLSLWSQLWLFQLEPHCFWVLSCPFFFNFVCLTFLCLWLCYIFVPQFKLEFSTALLCFCIQFLIIDFFADFCIKSILVLF